MRAVCSCSLFSFLFLFSLLAGALAAGLVDAFGGFIPRLMPSFASANRLSIKRDLRFANCPRRAQIKHSSVRSSVRKSLPTAPYSLDSAQSCAVARTHYLRSCTHALPAQFNAHYLRSRTHARTTCAIARTHYLRTRTHALPAQSHARTTCAVARTTCAVARTHYLRS